MRIDDDYEVFRLSRIIDSNSKNEGTSLLLKYWEKSDKLRILPVLLKNNDFPVEVDEIQYVIASENRCEYLQSKLNNLLAIKDGLKDNVDIQMSAETISFFQEFSALINRLTDMDLRAGWSNFYSNLFETISNICALIDRIIALSKSGQDVYFETNVKSNDFFEGSINFSTKKGKYFIFNN